MEKAEIEACFGVSPRSIEALPFGEDGHSYRLRTDRGDYHLKCIVRPVDAFALDLVRQLRESGAFPHVPRLVPARDGALRARSGDGFAVLSEWVEGPPVSPFGLLPAPVRLPVARALAELHAATPGLALEDAPVEDFRIPFAASLRRSLDGELHAPARPYRERIAEELAALELVAELAAALGAPHVLCHTDVHGGNLILDGEAALWLFDWDGARLAPCEQDLAGATNAHVPREELAGFIEEYQRAREARAPLHPELFELYYRRRCLEDLDLFLLGPPTPHVLQMIEIECLAWIDRMDADIAFVRDALSGARA
jgi:Ser/Thr protein kinase RdoA (MazF antagonist)